MQPRWERGWISTWFRHDGDTLGIVWLQCLQTAVMPEERTNPGIVPSGLRMLTTAACSYNLSQIPGLPQQSPQPLLPCLQ